MLVGQPEARGGRIDLGHSRGRHRSEPLAHVALVEAGPRRDLGRGRGRLPAHGVEQPGTMPHRQHQAQGAVVQSAQDPAGERVGPGPVEFSLADSGLGHGDSLLVSSWPGWAMALSYKGARAGGQVLHSDNVGM